MASNDPPTTRDVTSAYLLLRLPTAENTIFNTNVRDLKKCILERVITQPVGKLGESAKKCAMFLDILRTEDDFWWTDLSMVKYAKTSRLDTWKELRITALEHIFKNGGISLDAIMQLLEFTISQLIEVLFQKKIPLACALFDWMVVTMEKGHIGPAGETIEGWIAENGGWIKVMKFAVQSRIEPSSEIYNQPEDEQFPKGPSPRTIYCGNCQRCLTVTLGTIEIKCECTKWVCLIKRCGQSFDSERGVHRHFIRTHAPHAELDECQHCGNAKDRCLNRCPICGVLWCVNENCCFETHISRSLLHHKRRCGRSIRQPGAANIPLQRTYQSNTATNSPKAASPQSKQLPLTMIKCKNCPRRLLAPFGSVKERCTCGTWMCLVKGCSYSVEGNHLINQHFAVQHIKNAKLNECLHCGNFKDRGLTKCATCGALWCVSGDCRYETRNQRAMDAHKRACGKCNKRKQTDDQDKEASDEPLEEERIS